MTIAKGDYDLENTIRKYISQDRDFRSSLISTGTCSIKAIRRAIQASKNINDLESRRISIIDPQKIGQNNSVFYARPYRAFRRSKEFPWRYTADEKYPVWASIPEAAIVADVSLKELMSFMAHDPVLSAAFDMDLASDGKEKLTSSLRRRQTPLSSELTAGIVRSVVFLGMEICTPPAIVAKPVCEIIHGWCLVLLAQSPNDWLAEATVFAHAFVDSQDCMVVGDDEEYFSTISQAFLAGARTPQKAWAAHIEISQKQAQQTINREIKVGIVTAENVVGRPSLVTQK